MITIKQWMETIDYRISQGYRFGWPCYGTQAYALDSCADNYSVGMVFDLDTHTVYEVSVCDYVNNRAYQLFNPLWRQAHDDHARKLDPHNTGLWNQAWDQVSYTDLECPQDWLTKARAIVQAEPYDTRITIPLDLTDQEQLILFRLAHEKNMTFNDFCVEVLTQAVERLSAQGPDRV